MPAITSSESNKRPLEKYDTRQKVDSNFKKPPLNPNILVDNDQIRRLLWLCFVNMVWIWGEVRNSKFPQWCCSGSRSNQICDICNNKKNATSKKNYIMLTLLSSVLAWQGVDTSRPAKRKLKDKNIGNACEYYTECGSGFVNMWEITVNDSPMRNIKNANGLSFFCKIRSVQLVNQTYTLIHRVHLNKDECCQPTVWVNLNLFINNIWKAKEQDIFRKLNQNIGPNQV